MGSYRKWAPSFDPQSLIQTVYIYIRYCFWTFFSLIFLYAIFLAQFFVLSKFIHSNFIPFRIEPFFVTLKTNHIHSFNLDFDLNHFIAPSHRYRWRSASSTCYILKKFACRLPQRSWVLAFSRSIIQVNIPNSYACLYFAFVQTEYISQMLHSLVTKINLFMIVCVY